LKRKQYVNQSRGHEENADYDHVHAHVHVNVDVDVVVHVLGRWDRSRIVSQPWVPNKTVLEA